MLGSLWQIVRKRRIKMHLWIFFVLFGIQVLEEAGFTDN